MRRTSATTCLGLLAAAGVLMLLACGWAGGAEPLTAPAPVPAVPFPPEILDLSLQPPAFDTAPGPQYQDDTRDYGMIIGLERSPGGRLWVAWVGGGDSDAAYFLVASSDDDGRTWSRPRLVIDPTDAPGLRRRTLVGNLWCDPKGRLWLFFDLSMGQFDGRAGDWATVCENPDAAAPVWGPPRRLWHGATLCKPTVLSSGEWLLPISLWTRNKIRPAALIEAYHELDDQRMAHVFVSTDAGATWTRRGGVAFPESDFDEHMIVERRDGSLWMLSRVKTGIAESVSADRGRTWSPPQPSAIKSVNARFFVRRLQSGRLLLVKHGERIGEAPRGRSHLTAFVSDDDGRTWRGGLLLDERKSVSYPDGFQAPDGSISIAYDRNRAADREILLAKFTEEDVLAGRAVSASARLKVLINKAMGVKKTP